MWMSLGSSSLSFRASLGAEMRDLRRRVNTGVGATRSVELEVFSAGDDAHRAIDLTLHGPGVLLNLPAAVARSGVFDRQLQARHVPPRVSATRWSTRASVGRTARVRARQSNIARHCSGVAATRASTATRYTDGRFSITDQSIARSPTPHGIRGRRSGRAFD